MPEGLFGDTHALERIDGVLPSQTIREMIQTGRIRANSEIAEDQIQPASLDLRLGEFGWRVPSSFLPGKANRVAEKLRDLARYRFRLTDGAHLEERCVYIVEIDERLHLPEKVSAIATPKSTTGRLDIFTRLISDHAAEFESLPESYAGPLFLEVSPRSFSIAIRSGARLNQVRFRRGRATASDTMLRRLHKEYGIVGSGTDHVEPRIDNGLRFSVDLHGESPGSVVVYKAKHPSREVVDIGRLASYDPASFWDRVEGPLESGFVLYPGEFYILASREAVRVPPIASAEMVGFDTSIGEFRVHYAGFFDPGFGYHPEQRTSGTPAVLEVRAHETPFLLEHGQEVGRLVYELTCAMPDKIYGQGIGSNYARQGLTLAKQFRRE